MNQIFNKLFLLIFSISLSITQLSFAHDTYHYTIDLKNIKEDKVKVILICPRIKETSAIFVVPRVIPGSYSWKEYGRFFADVKGYDSLGNEIKLSRKKNIFYVKKSANLLYKIEYFVNDTWDDTDLKKFIFQPGGSNIEANKNIVINGHAFLGYFEGYKNLSFELSIEKPVHLYGSTHLKKESIRNDLDFYRVKNYFELSDNPIMYCKPDTASFQLDKTRIYISSFSNTGLVKADSLAKWLYPLTNSLRNFLGKLPIEEYHFIFYFGSSDQLVKVPKGKGLSGYGALEHNHCSFYYLPERKSSTTVREMVQDVGAHEFLHIITPLNLHSEEIADFNFRNPKMSKHLWMYEGITEYFSWLVRVQNNLVTENKFIEEMQDKLVESDRYGLFSFTEMSENVLKPEFQEKYSDVYLKGAIFGMLLDQRIIKVSNGEKNLKDVMLQLMEKYGPEKSFKDDDFFTEFTQASHSDVGDFIRNYIEGANKLPLSKQLDWFGYTYTEKELLTCYHMGYFSYSMTEKSQLEIKDVLYGPFIKNGDLIVEVNGIPVSDSTYSIISEKYLQFNTNYSPYNVKLIRDGALQTVKIYPIIGKKYKTHAITLGKNLTTDQIRLKNKWLGKSTN